MPGPTSYDAARARVASSSASKPSVVADMLCDLKVSARCARPLSAFVESHQRMPGCGPTHADHGWPVRGWARRAGSPAHHGVIRTSSTGHHAARQRPHTAARTPTPRRPARVVRHGAKQPQPGSRVGGARFQRRRFDETAQHRLRVSGSVADRGLPDMRGGDVGTGADWASGRRSCVGAVAPPSVPAVHSPRTAGLRSAPAVLRRWSHAMGDLSSQLCRRTPGNLPGLALRPVVPLASTTKTTTVFIVERRDG